MSWQPIDTAPKGKKILLKFYADVICSGSYRYGRLGEPDQDRATWRADCCGRYGSPHGWMEVP